MNNHEKNNLLNSIYLSIITASDLTQYLIKIKNIIYLLEENQKTIQEIEKLYQEFLDNYYNLNNIFNFNNQIQIYTLYKKLLLDGYLSKDKTFNFRNDLQNETTKKLYGTKIFTGYACCRHISAMLCDILNNLNIPSCTVHVYFPDSTDDYLIKDEKTLINYQNQKIFLELLKKIIGNHAITYSYQNEKNYFLDASCNDIYELNKSKKNILTSIDNKNNTPIFIKKTTEGYNFPIKKITKKNNISYDEVQLFANEVKNIYHNNIDIFEHFYNENQEIYKNIYSKTLNFYRFIK